MEKSWRISALGAGAAFGISVLFGIFGGVGFGTLLVRAIAGALIFAGLGVGAAIIIRRFLPELFGASSDSSSWGEGIDITLPDVNPHISSSESDDASGLISLSGSGGGMNEGIGSADGVEDQESLVEEIEESPRADMSGLGIQDSLGADLEPVEDLDVLPDVGAFENSFTASFRNEDASVGGLGSGGSGRALGDSAEKNSGDPALLAKVVQTILRKEKEG